MTRTKAKALWMKQALGNHREKGVPGGWINRGLVLYYERAFDDLCTCDQCKSALVPNDRMREVYVDRGLFSATMPGLHPPEQR